jgi:hypothetical protein
MGFPGFGDNAFPSLYGEYRLEFPDQPPSGGASGPGVFSLWLSGEALYFPEGLWEGRPGTGGYRILQRKEGESLLAATVLDGGPNHGLWTAAFQFPRGLEPLGLDDSGANQLIRAWVSRFLYFLSLVKTPGEVSLPAVVSF